MSAYGPIMPANYWCPDCGHYWHRYEENVFIHEAPCPADNRMEGRPHDLIRYMDCEDLLRRI